MRELLLIIWSKLKSLRYKRRRINVYCGFWRTTVVPAKSKIVGDIAFVIPCLECDGTGIFDCGIEEEEGTCVRCKGTVVEFIGL